MKYVKYTVLVFCIFFLFLTVQEVRDDFAVPSREAPKSDYQLDTSILDQFEISVPNIDVPVFNPVKEVSPDDINIPSESIFFFDEEYSVISDEQLVTFLEWWKIFLIKNDIIHRKNSFDCDNFSSLFKSIMFLTNKHLSASGQIFVGSAIVEQKYSFAYIPSSGSSWHMMNIVYTNRGWYMVEPQNGLYIHIDHYPNKILSIYF